ncbi:MAG: hypothetical protein IT430_03990 [Phycisphaerales bacterium]|nr:hypothetical protein [Phycisphaerales bacterium]
MNDQMQQFQTALVKLDRAVGALIDRDVEDDNLRDARCLLTSALMRSCGVSQLLQRFVFEPENVSIVYARPVLKAVHDAFGAPGDWGGDLCDALRAIYNVRLEAQPSRSE